MFLAPEGGQFGKMSNISHISYLVKFHEFPHTVEHVMVLGSGAGHLLYDGCDVTKYRGVQQGWNYIYIYFF